MPGYSASSQACTVGFFLVRALDELLRGKTPAVQLFTDAAHLQINVVVSADKLACGSLAPQAKVHLQFPGSVANDDALNGLRLHLAEHAAIAFAAATASWANGGLAGIKQIARFLVRF